MTATISCDHAGAEAVARARRRAVISGTELRLVVTAPIVRRVLSVSGVDRLVSIYPSLESATAVRQPAPVPALAGGTAAAGTGSRKHRPGTRSSSLRICTVGEDQGSPEGRGSQRFRLEVWLSASDVGERVVIRWRRPAPGGGEEIADVLGVLEAADGSSLRIRKASGELVTIPRDRALAGKTIPAPPRDRGAVRKGVPGHGH
jgi:hypothetical protein